MTLRDLLPPKVRRAVYVALGVLVPVEAIWDVVDDAIEGKAIATLAALGFALAASNTPASHGDDHD